MDNQQYYGQPYYGQPYQQRQQRQQPGWICRPVSCREEALAVPMDYTCAGVIMPDVAHNAVYVKRFLPDTGETSFGDFAAVPAPKPVQADEFVTRADFAKLCEIVQRMQGELRGDKEADA